MKGHKTRVVCSIRRHSTEPTFIERAHVFSVLYEYMNSVMGVEPWFLVDSTFCSIPEHFHSVSCDLNSDDPEEVVLLDKTPKIKFPLKQNILIGIPCHNEEKHIEIGRAHV